MKVILIGTGVAVPSPRRRSPALLVEAGREKLLFDCGPDTLHGLARAGIDHRTVDRIILTHYHPDHTLGIPHFLFASRYELEPRKKNIYLAGPPGLKKLLAGFRRIYPGWLEGRGYRVIETVLEDKTWAGEGWRLAASSVRHNPESLAYRIEDTTGRSAVFTGDTGYSKAVIGLAAGSDLLISECSFPDGVELDTHLTPTRAGEMAEKAGAKKLVLTHMYPPGDDVDLPAAAAKKFSGEVIRGEDGMCLEV